LAELDSGAPAENLFCWLQNEQKRRFLAKVLSTLARNAFPSPNVHRAICCNVFIACAAAA
jgi:hypothetical protein